MNRLKYVISIKMIEFELQDMKGNKLSLEDFPMFLEVVLRKPGIQTKK